MGKVKYKKHQTELKANHNRLDGDISDSKKMPNSNDSGELVFSQRAPAIGKLWIIGMCAALFAPTLFAPLFTKYGYSPDLHMSFMIQVSMLTLASIFFLGHIKQREIVFVKNPLILPVLLFYGWALISIFWAHNRFESMISLLDWGAGVVGFLLISNALRKPEDTRIIVQAIFLTGVLLGFLGWNQYLLGVTWVQQHAPPSATFNNKNMAAQYGVLVMPLGIGLFLSARERFSYWAYAIGTAIVFVFVMYTFTRNAYLNLIGVFSALTVFLIVDKLRGTAEHFSREKKMVALLAVLLAFFMLMLGPSQSGGISWYGLDAYVNYNERFQSIGPAAKLDGTGVPRIAMWFNSLEMIKEHPLLGVGMGNWMVYYPLYQTSSIIDFEMSEAIQHINAHNDYVEILSDLGIIGFSFLLFLGVRLFWTAIKTFYGRWDNNPNRYLVLGVLLGCMGIGINAFFSFPFKQPAPIMVFLAYLGILAVEYSRVTDAKLWRFKAASRAAAVGMVLSILTVSVFVVHYQWNESEIHFRKATIASHQKKYHEMKREGQLSHDAMPLRNRMYNFIGMGHLRTGNAEAAAKYLELVKKSYPNRNNTLQNLGYIYLELAEDARRKNDAVKYKSFLEKALENFTHMVDIRPDSYRAHRNLGITYVRLNQPKPAYIHLETSVAIERANGNLNAGNGSINNLIQQLKTQVKAKG